MGLGKCTNTSLDEYYCIDSATSSTNPQDSCDSENAVAFSGQYAHELTSSFLHMIGTPTTVTVIGIPSTTSSPSTASTVLQSQISQNSNSLSPSSQSGQSPQSSQASPGPDQSQQPNAISPTNAAKSPNNNTGSRPTALGAGIAVPVGLLVVAFIAFIAWKSGCCHRRSASSHDSNGAETENANVGQHHLKQTKLGGFIQGYGSYRKGKNYNEDRGVISELPSHEMSELPVNA